MNGCALLAVLLAGSPDGGPTRVSAKLKFDVPGALEEVDVPGMLKVSGMPLKMRAVRSKLSVPALTEHFIVTFEAEGFFLPRPEQLSAPGPHVTGYDVNKHIAYTALFQPNSDGSVTVILSEAYVHARRAPEPFAPVFPGASSALDSQTEGAKSLHYTTAAPPKEVEAFYREVLGKAGCREVEPLAFECQGKLNRVWVRQRPNQPTSVVVQQSE